MHVTALTASTLGLAALMVMGCSNPAHRFAPAVQKIRDGLLKPDRAGTIHLPAEFKGMTPRNEVYVEQKADGRLLILFPAAYGRGKDIEGYLFCSANLLPSDFYAIDWGKGGIIQHINVAGWDMLTVENHGTNWYRVTRRLD